MNLSPRLFILLPLLLILAGCGKKKKTTASGDDPVEVEDFISFFPESTVPYQVGDSVFRSKKDTLVISFANFSRFVPDSVVKKLFGKSLKPRIYAMSRWKTNEGSTFLLTKTINNNRNNLLALAFDKKNVFIAALNVLEPDQSATTTQSFLLDRRYSFTKSIVRRNKDNSVSDGKEVYALNLDKRAFELVMLDALDEKQADLVNPIDTLSRKHKYTADYTNGKMNLVSVRDGRRSDRVSFFIHIEKDKGACIGELKGEAVFRKPNIAEYRQDGDPCILQFIFSNNAVILKEIEGCGSRRGLQCVFDGSFARKRVGKTK